MTTTRQALHSSATVEWYTPSQYIEAARAVMGSIDLDPASCDTANKIVKAALYFDVQTNGLDKTWSGNVFMNPPYGRGGQALWSKKMIDQYVAKNVTQGIMLLNAATDTKWFQQLWQYTICFVNERIRFVSEDGVQKHSPTHGNVFVYLGPDAGKQRFISEFKKFGPVVTAVSV